MTLSIRPRVQSTVVLTMQPIVHMPFSAACGELLVHAGLGLKVWGLLSSKGSA